VLVRAAAVLLTLFLLGACTEDGPGPPTGSLSLSPESTSEPGDGGALDAVADTLELSKADEDSFVDDVLLDPDGEPVLLLSSSTDDDRQLMRPTATEGWTVLRQSELGADVRVGRLLTAGPDGVLAVGVQGGRPALFEIADDGSATVVPVAGSPEGVDDGLGWLAPDGVTVYVEFPASGGGWTVAAVDRATGSTTASAASPFGGRFVGFAGTDLVFVNTGSADERRTEITRLSADLTPAGSIELDESYVGATGAADGTVYATQLGPRDDGFVGEVSLLSAAPDAAEAATVWSVPDAYLVDTLYEPVVSPDGAWAYVPSQQYQRDRDPLALRLTPVDLATGEPGGSVLLCEGYHFGGMAFAEDGDSAVAGVRCDGSDVPMLVTLR
jgi:hypothetical protein